jgi:mono/diheme cytochrome c family protein
MNRFFAASLLTLLALSGLAFMLIAIIIARSPYTHGNLSSGGYDRTEVAYVGQEYDFEGVGLADPDSAMTGDPVQDGSVIFVQYGCASCHGFSGQEGLIGEDLDDASPSEILREVRKGSEGMPAYGESLLTDEEVEKIVAFLKAVDQQTSNEGAIEEPDGASRPK